MDRQDANVPINSEAVKTTATRTGGSKKYVLIGIVALIFFIAGILTILVINSLLLKPVTNTTTNANNETSIEENNIASLPVVTDKDINQETPKSTCTDTFESSFLDLSFEYDNCIWEISENIYSKNNTTFSTVSAKHTSGYEVKINSLALGMGGGYPNCVQALSTNLLKDDVVRVESSYVGEDANSTNYKYLNKSNDYGIMGKSGKFGDEKFDEYFEFLNPQAFPNVNFCYRASGMNAVEILNPKEKEVGTFLALQDIEVVIQEANITDIDFLNAADDLAVSVLNSTLKETN